MTAQKFLVEPEDLQWWLELDPTLKYRFAQTMQTTPHSYVVRNKSLGDEDYLRSFGVMQTFGIPGKFYSRTNIYLHSGDTRWWNMANHHWESIILNRSDDGKEYGTQDAPLTVAPEFTEYDRLAAFYDDEHRLITEQDKSMLWMACVIDHSYLERVLDIGAGTGGTLDARVAGSRNCHVVDPSQGMLNALVYKFPQVARVWPMTAADYLGQQLNTRFNLAVAGHGSASYLSIEEIEGLRELSPRLVLSFYKTSAAIPRPLTLPATHQESLDHALTKGSPLGKSSTFVYVELRGK